MKFNVISFPFCFVLIFFFMTASGQRNESKSGKKIDSLFNLALSPVNDTGKVMALYYLALYLRREDPQKAITYGEEGLALARHLKWKKGEADCLKNLGNTFHFLSIYPREKECYELSLKIFEEIGDSIGIGKCLNNIGITHYYLKEYDKAIYFYLKSLKIMESKGFNPGIANSLNNLGGAYNDKGDYAKAFDYYRRTLELKMQLNDSTGMAICLTNLGSWSKNIKNYPKALDYFNNALQISRKLRDKPGEAASLAAIGDLYLRLKDYHQSHNYASRALTIAGQIGTLDTQRDALLTIASAYEMEGNMRSSLSYLKQYHIIRDSILDEAKIKQIVQTGLQVQYARRHSADSLRFQRAMLLRELSYREELHRKNIQRNGFISSFVLILMISGALFSRLRYTRRAKEILQKEQNRSEKLLTNILPGEIARELKEKGWAEAIEHEKVSVLFADIEDFTKTAEKLNARELVEEIHTCFGAFDEICSKFHIEKIKTIGDAYMAAGGVPLWREDSVRNTVLSALAMQDFLCRRKNLRDYQGLPGFQMRIGIHTGSVVAGIVGIKKFQYDIWGDAVNTASRMESAGQVCRVNISQSTYECICDDQAFTFEYRGKIHARNKGEMDMYFVSLSDPEKKSM